MFFLVCAHVVVAGRGVGGKGGGGGGGGGKNMSDGEIVVLYVELTVDCCVSPVKLEL